MKKIDLLNNLKIIGFEENEGKILNYLYDVKKATVLNMARDLKIPRTNVYNLINSIKNKYSATEVYENGNKYIVPESIDSLTNYVKRKKDIATKTVNYLENEYKKTKQEAKIHYSYGNEGFKKFAEHILDSRDKSVRAFVDLESLQKLASKRYLLNFNDRRIRKKLEAKIIVSENNKDFLNKNTTIASNEKNKQWFKIIPGLGNFNMNMVVYDDNVIIFAPKNEGYCLHFESPGFAKTMNDMFDYMWKKGEWVN